MRKEKPNTPTTVAHIERALDRLAVIMDNDPPIAMTLLPMFQLLDEECEKLRATESYIDRVRTRARRSRGHTAAQSY